MQDVIVVGGGIVGTAVSAALIDAGLSVLLIEASIIGGGATAEGMGHLVVIDEPEPEYALCRYSMELWDQLVASGIAGDEYARSGTLWLANDDEEWELARTKKARLDLFDLPCELVSSDRLQEMEPELKPDLRGALRVLGDGVVYPPRIARRLLEDRAGSSLEVMESTRVTAMTGRDVQLADGRSFTSRYTIDAAGQEAAKLTPGFVIRPRKGHLAITARYPGFVHHQLVELAYVKNAHESSADSVSFNVQPRPNGQILIGSTRQYGAIDRSIDPHMLDGMLGRAIEMLPRLSERIIIRAWTGFRPASEDGLPIIGPHPRDPSLFLAAGHEGLGITTSLGTAAIIADLILERSPAIPITPYAPSRFDVQHA